MFEKRANVFDVPERLKRATAQMADLKENTYQRGNNFTNSIPGCYDAVMHH